MTPLKAVILAGGIGSRISEETSVRPKPMVEIGGRPMLWHIMKLYSAHGVNDFVICCGYRGYVIKEYFANYFLHMSDVTFDMATNSMQVHHRKSEPWRVTLVDTGEATMTGGRLRRVAEHVRDQDAFFFTYGDGLADVDITAELAFHRAHGALATILAVQPPGRYGALAMHGSTVTGFTGATAGSSTGASSSCRPHASTLLRATRPAGRPRRFRGSRRAASSGPSSTTASGTRWTRSATGITSRNSGLPGGRRGKLGHDRGTLARYPRFPDGAYRLQGRLAGHDAP
jgi:glucose-1-phosphate cytidylyltransferase